MSTLTGGDLNLVKPELTDDHKVTIGTDLPANFQKIDDEFSTHLADLVTDTDGAHGLKIESGTWTPEIKLMSGTPIAGMVYLVQTGIYYKIGDLLYVLYSVALSNKGSSTGSIGIFGYPFAFIPVTDFTITRNIIYPAGTTTIVNQGYDFGVSRPVGVGSEKDVLALDTNNLTNTSIFQGSFVIKL